MDTVTLTMTEPYAVVLHSFCHAEYLSFLRMADSMIAFGSLSATESLAVSDLSRNELRAQFAESFRDQAEAFRGIGQQIELQIPELEAANWRWPQ